MPAMEPIARECPVQNEPGARGLVAGPNSPLLGEPPEEAADFHQITREFDHLGVGTIPFQDGRGDRIYVHVKTNPDTLSHANPRSIEGSSRIHKVYAR